MRRKKLFAIGMIVACILSGCGNTGGEAAGGSTGGMPEESIPDSVEEGTDISAESRQESNAEQEKPTDNSEESTVESAESKDSRELEEDEKQFFTEFIQQWENYGFLLSDYAVPEDVNLDEVLYSGAGFGENLPEEDTSLYLEAVQRDFVETDCLKFTRQSIEDFLQRKLGIGLADLNIPFEWLYLSETDAYYHEAGDTNYMRFSCVGGSVAEDTYTLRFSPESDWAMWQNDCETVILKMQDGYRFVSNRTLPE